MTIFFVLSGFFIGFSFFNQYKSGKFNFSHYFSRRWIRLSIVLFPGLVLGFLLDYLGLKWFSNDAAYSGGNVIGSISEGSLTLSSFFGNAFYLQTILVPTFGSNSALWSLANEFWYYMLFPLMVLAMSLRNSIKSRFAYLAVFVLLAYFVGYNIMLYFPIWLSGLLLVLYIHKVNLKTRSYNWVLITGLGFILTLLALRLLPEQDSKFLERIYVTSAFVIFCIAIISADRAFKRPEATAKPAQKLANFSYTLYVIHTPMLCFSRGWLINDLGFWQVTPKTILYFFGIILFITFSAYLLAKVTENHTHWIYKKLKI